MIKSKLSKKEIIEVILTLEKEIDDAYLKKVVVSPINDFELNLLFERRRTLNELIKRISPEPKKQYVKKGASKILKNINQ
jgi:hypothetical protein